MGWRGVGMPLPPLAPPYKGGERRDKASLTRWRGWECKDHYKRRWMLAWGSMPPSANLAALLSDYASLIRPTFSCLTNADSGFFNDDQGGLRDIHILLQQPVAHSHDVVGFQIPGSQKHDTPIGLVFMNGRTKITIVGQDVGRISVA